MPYKIIALLTIFWTATNSQAAEDNTDLNITAIIEENQKPTQKIISLQEEAKIESWKAFPKSEIIMGDLIDHLNPLFAEGVAQEFWPLIGAMFTPEFGRPTHSPETIAKGWRCLYEKLYLSQELYCPDQEKIATYQLKALYQLLNLHRHIFDHKFPILARKIPQIPGCPSCHDTARVQQTEEYTTGSFNAQTFFDLK